MECPFAFMKKSMAHVVQSAEVHRDPLEESYIYQEKLGELNEQMRMIGLTEGDLRLLKQLRPQME
ncbi:hypothetical protein M2277_005916 [Paenibacillus sp. LBL]|nr:hypothetical protein [Paenibacillus sp. LBL]MDH6675217.1 hypothetical protein [Paenibacillus sp. LBL]